MTGLIINYLACWNETDTDARRALIEQHWSETATYVDPMAEVAGRDDLNATIGAVQQQFPGFVFTPVGDVDALSNALCRVLETPGRAQEMGARGLAKIQTWSFEEDVSGLRDAIAQATRKIVA